MLRAPAFSASTGSFRVQAEGSLLFFVPRLKAEAAGGRYINPARIVSRAARIRRTCCDVNMNIAASSV